MIDCFQKEGKLPHNWVSYEQRSRVSLVFKVLWKLLYRSDTKTDYSREIELGDHLNFNSDNLFLCL
ncbi:MAG: hypothetical protein ACI9FU_002470 [Granulosicoccus sp.]